VKTRISVLSLAVGLLLLALPACAALQERTGPDSFLPYRAYTVEALVQQVENDPVVRQRLAKHFHVSQAELVGYLQANLQVVSFDSSGWRPVYGVTRTGRIYRSRDYFQQDGKVFGLADGTPVLKYACGNPLTTNLPPVKRKKIVEAPPLLPQFVPEQPEAESVPALVTPPVQAPEEYALLPAVPLAQPLSVLPTIITHHSLPLWPLLGLVGLHNGDGGGDGPPPPVIPEPSSLLLLGGGLALLGRRFLRRSSR